MSKIEDSKLEQNISEDRQQVLETLKNCYGIEGEELSFLAQGYSHKNYLLDLSVLGGKVVVKISHPGRIRPGEDINFESMVANFLGDHGYPVQSAIKSFGGNFFEYSGDKRSIQVLRFLDASRQEKPNQRRRILLSGKFLARLHKISRHFNPANYELDGNLLARRTFYLRNRLQALELNLLTYDNIPSHELRRSGITENLDFLKNEYRSVAKFLTLQRKRLLPKFLIHGDYNPGNIIFNGNEISGIIDFEHCGFGPFYYDLGFAIAHWSFILNKYGVERITRIFVAGYEQDGGKISLELVKAFRSFAALWRLADAIRYFDKYPDKAHWASEVKYYLGKCRKLAM